MAATGSPLHLQLTGSDALLKKLRRLKGVAPVVLGVALYEVAHEIIEYGQNTTVPRDFGNLAASGTVELPIVTRMGALVRLGFGGASAPYAYVTHFNPRAGKTGGVSPSGRQYKHWAKVGGWKYLEKALARYERRVPTLVGRVIQREWGALLT